MRLRASIPADDDPFDGLTAEDVRRIRGGESVYSPVKPREVEKTEPRKRGRRG